MNEIPHSPPRRARRRWLSLALIAALVAVALSQRSPSVEVEEFRLLPYPSSEAARPGGSWIAELRLRGDGYPLLFHLDEDGWPELLYPRAGLRRLNSQQTLLLPDPAHGVSWSWPEPIEGRNFLAVASARARLDLDALVERLRRETSRAPSADEARARVKELLESTVGPALSARVTPLPTPPGPAAGQT